MKISYNWLKQYTNINVEPEKLSELLTDCGLEVEGLEKFQPIKGGLEGIVIGEVKTKEQHPNADKLTVTTVDVGRDELLNIVCGAPNVEAGQKVLVATIGTWLFMGDDSFQIKKSKIRGQLSEGMICAEDELGLGKSHEGIMVLEPAAEIGTPAKEHFNIQDDYTFEIGLTPNRADATSHFGVARDLVAVFNHINSNSSSKFNCPSVENFKADNHNTEIDIIVEDNEACPRYSGLTISGVKVEESPEWLKTRLLSIGVRPINNIVDITNFVLFETGQPLHAFDVDEITGSKVIVKKLKQGTKFITLDEVERELTANDLMICNEIEGMCIGGVFGGEKSGVNENTTKIFLESAYFDPKTIRKTSKYFGLQTDASFRFERGADPEMTIFALKRAALLIKQIVGGEISSEIIDIYPNPISRWTIDVSYKNVNRLIGKTIDRGIINKILIDLDFEIIDESTDGIKVRVPTRKVDVKREVDIIEEILRIYGYNNVEFPAKVNSSISFCPYPDPEKVQNIIADYLSNNGFTEIMNNSLTKSKYLESNTTDLEPKNNVKILNPLSQDLDVLRQSLVFGGLETIIYNINRKIPDLKLFEFGKSYSFNNDKGEENLNKYVENIQLALFITGKNEPENWKTDQTNVEFYDIKVFVSNIFRRLGFSNTLLDVNHNVSKIFIEGLSYNYNNHKLAELGQLSNNVLKDFDITQDVFYVEINWDLLLNIVKNFSIQYQETPKYPEVRRDLALLIDKSVRFEEIEKLAYQTEKSILKKINIFDVYEGEKIAEDKKSYAVSFILQSPFKTLTDKLIDKTMNRLINVFEKNLNAKIR